MTSMSGKESTIHLNQTNQLPSMQNVFMDADIAGKTLQTFPHHCNGRRDSWEE